jgi:uncharacterized protein (TIGR00725 family)
MPRVLYVAIIGPGEDASAGAIADATSLGRLVAEQGWITLTGGRAAGVMAAAAAGASAAGGMSVGILPGIDRRDAAPGLSVALATGLGEARNAVLVTTADAVIACGLNPGTISEIALALRARKPTVLVRPDATAAAFFQSMGGNETLHTAVDPEDAVVWLGGKGEGGRGKG